MESPCAPLVGQRDDTPSRLRGILKLLEAPLAAASSSSASSSSPSLPLFDYDPVTLYETQSALQNRRKRGNLLGVNTPVLPSRLAPFHELASRHRFVCFFFIQRNESNRHSAHTLALRKLLAIEYHDSMTVFLVQVGGNADHGHDQGTCTGDIFCLGTSFCAFPNLFVVTALMNVTQLPAVVVIDTTTGRSLSSDALLAIEKNDAHRVINSWQQGKSGLSCLQKVFAVLVCESSCTIS